MVNKAKIGIILPGPGDQLPAGITEWVDTFRKHFDVMLKRLTGRETKWMQPESGYQVHPECEACILMMHAGHPEKMPGDLPEKTLQKAVRLMLSRFPPGGIPDELARIENFDFFTKGPGKGDQGLLSPRQKEYWLKLADLVIDISERFDNRKTGREPDKKETIYLAVGCSGQESERDVLRREFSQWGYRVVPGYDLSCLDAGKLIDHIREQCANSILSVHIIGDEFGTSSGAGNEPVDDMQIRICEEVFSQQRGQPGSGEWPYRFIWLPAGFVPRNEQQSETIQRLKRSAASQPNTEIIQNPLEAFKEIVRKKLLERSVDTKTEKSRQKARKSVYMICDRNDLQKIEPIKKTIFEHGFEPLIIDYGSGKYNLIHEHKQHLVECDGVIVYYGNRNEKWLMSKLKDLLKSPGFGRQKPIPGKAVLKDPGSKVPDIQGLGDLLVIDHNGEPAKALLQPFFDKLT